MLFMSPKPFLEPRSPEDVELVVIDSKTQCPDCGRVVSVNVKRGFLYSHAPKGGAGNCPIRTPYYLRIESVAQPIPKLPTSLSAAADKAANLLWQERLSKNRVGRFAWDGEEQEILGRVYKRSAPAE